MKTHLGIRTGSKNPKKRVKTHPNTEECSASKSTIRHFKSAKWPPFGLWPNSLQVNNSHCIEYYHHLMSLG